jgi:hypothetical protein
MEAFKNDVEKCAEASWALLEKKSDIAEALALLRKIFNEQLGNVGSHLYGVVTDAYVRGFVDGAKHPKFEEGAQDVGGN